MNFTEYKDNGGIVDENEFNQLYPSVFRTIEAYIQSMIPKWRIKPLEDYDIELISILVEQINLISMVGGIKAFYGQSDFNVKEINTSGYKVSMENNEIQFFQGIPLSPISNMIIINELRISGLITKVMI